MTTSNVKTSSRLDSHGSVEAAINRTLDQIIARNRQPVQPQPAEQVRFSSDHRRRPATPTRPVLTLDRPTPERLPSPSTASTSTASTGTGRKLTNDQRPAPSQVGNPYNLTGQPEYIIPGVSMSMIARGTGLTVSHVSRIFNGNRQPTLAKLKLIADYLELDIDRVVRIIDTRIASRKLNIEHTLIN